MAEAITHMRSLEYGNALVQLRSWVKQNPEDLRAWNYIPATLLYQEMFQRGLLEAQIYGHDGEAYDEKKKTPLSKRFEEELASALDQAQALAEERLKKAPNDVEARYWLGVTHGTRASYLFTLQRSFLSALREGGKASEIHEQLLKENPGFADARLVTGIRSYVAGVLPWYIKWVASISGQGGNREEGLKQILQAAENGHYAREDAKVVLYVLSFREGRHDQAARLLQDLTSSYPRNFVLKQDLATVYGEQGNWQAAASVYDQLIADKRAGGHDQLAWEKLLYQAGSVYQKLKRPAQALELYKEAATQPTKDRFVYRAELEAARLLAKMDRQGEARQRFQRVISALPNSEEAKEAKRELGRLRG